VLQAIAYIAAIMVSPKPPLHIVIAAPRGFCAGVDRAIEIVELSIERYGPPVYVPHAIVHNKYVVYRLRGLCAVFVDALTGALKSGHAFVTNSALLGLTIDGKRPGGALPRAGKYAVHVAMRSPVAMDPLELVENGRVIKAFKLTGQPPQFDWSVDIDPNAGGRVRERYPIGGGDGGDSRNQPVWNRAASPQAPRPNHSRPKVA